MPHIHIDYGRQRHVASFSIETGKRIIKGTLDRKYDGEIRGWLSKHKEKLLMVWREMQRGGDQQTCWLNYKVTLNTTSEHEWTR